MTSRGFATPFTLSVGVTLALASLSGAPVKAADEHNHVSPTSNELVKLVRDITEPYKDVAAAEAAGYALAFG